MKKKVARGSLCQKSLICQVILSAEDARKHVLYVGKIIDDTMDVYNKVVELDQLFTGKERSYATEELAENIKVILVDYFRDENTNSDSDNPSLGIVYQMFPENNDEVAKPILKDFLNVRK